MNRVRVAAHSALSLRFRTVLSLVSAAIFFVLIVAAPLRAALFDDEEARRQVAAERKRIDELRGQQQAIEARISRIEEGLKNQPVLDLFTQLEAIRLELN